MEFSDFGKKLTSRSGILLLMDDLGKPLPPGVKPYPLGGGNPARIDKVEKVYREEMEKILSDLPNSGEMRADRILELNPDHPIFGVIQGVRDNEELFKTYAELLYDQALLLAGLKIDDQAGFAARITRLMVK